MLNKDGVAIAVLGTNTAFGRIQVNLHHVAGRGGADKSACRSQKRQPGMKHVIAGKVIFGKVFLRDASVIERRQRPGESKAGQWRGESADLGDEGIRRSRLVRLQRGGADGRKIARVSDTDDERTAQRVHSYVAPGSIVFGAASTQI